MKENTDQARGMGLVGASWGVAGVSLLIGSAAIQISEVAIEAFSYPFRWFHWAFLVVFFVVMLFSEGYRGFQLGFSPRVAARARYLSRNPRPLHVLLAPLLCMGFIHATKRRRRSAIILTLAIVMFVVLVRLLNQPWRGIVDLGVVGGLVWGLVALWLFTYVAFARETFDFPPDLPE